MKTVIICAGGPKEELVDFKQLTYIDDVVYVGADRGALVLLQNGITPADAVGDFDSLSQEEYDFVNSKVAGIVSVSSDKDETDTDLAIAKALEFHPEQIYLTGVTGGRLDHFMAVLNSVFRFQSTYHDVSFTILNKWNEIFLLTPGEHKLIKKTHLPYISFFGFQGPVAHISLTGMKYDVADEMIEIGDSRFTSNELLNDEGSISFTSGICLVIRSSDE